MSNVIISFNIPKTYVASHQPFLQLAAAEPLFNVCPEPTLHRYLDISSAKIQKSKNLQFSIELTDTAVQMNSTGQGLVLRGNFSRLLLKNAQTGKESVYEGREMEVKIPANHVFNLEKIPEIEIQINHAGVDLEEDNPIRYIMLSQLYVVSKFTSRIETFLSKYIHKDLSDQDILPTSTIIKIFNDFPMLIYRGTSETYPCRNDLLCFIKRQYQLIGEEDYQKIKELVSVSRDKQAMPKKAFRRKSMYEIHPMKKVEARRVQKGVNDEL